MINTKIEWATHTLNFWWGCAKVSEACAHCYAEAMARRLGRGQVTWGVGGKRWLRFERAALELELIVKRAKKTGTRPRVFVNSMSDTFEDHPELVVTRCMMLVHLAAVPEVDFLLLTKRPENVRKMVPPGWLEPGKWPRQVWVGTTVENQAAADRRVPELLGVPARVRFLSCEPLLGEVDLDQWLFYPGARTNISGIHWVICGGESGRAARPMSPRWVKSLCAQCQVVGIPFFFKQWGEWYPGWYSSAKRTCWIHPDDFSYLGKACAGRTLDGVVWNDVPEVAS